MLDVAAAQVPERTRKHIVRLVLLSFWLLIFEGSLRKWVAPHYSQYLFFIRDPVALLVYVLAMRSGVFRQQPVLLYAGLALGVLVTMMSVALVLAGGGQYTPVLALYGLRNYFLYIPMAFVIGRCFTIDDLRTIAWHGLLAIMVAAPLAVLQFNAPGTHPLNVGIAAESSLRFDNLTSAGGKVRPAGTFTSAVGMSQLIPLCIVFLMWAWTSSRKPAPVKLWIAVPGALAVAAALAVSGSRTSFIYSCLVILAGFLATPLRRGTGSKLKSAAIPIAVAVAFTMLFPVVFPEAFSTFTARWNDAAAVEGKHTLGWGFRIVHGLYDFTRLMGDMPLFGHGVGMAGNGAASAGITLNGVKILRVAEEDWSRHVVELGPVLALLFISYRVWFGAWLGLRAWSAMLRSGESLPLMLFVYAAVPLIQGQITGHGLVNGFGWLSVGICIAATRAVVSVPVTANAPGADSPLPLQQAVPFPNLMR
jgi:hypothetical protein